MCEINGLALKLHQWVTSGIGTLDRFNLRDYLPY